METEKTCSGCVCFLVCSRIAIDFQMREKWNANNAEAILKAKENGNGDNSDNGHNKAEDFFSFMASGCEFFFSGKKIVEVKEPILNTS